MVINIHKRYHKTARLSIGELLPQNLAEENYVWPVELLDAALQSSIGLLTHDELLLPIAAESVKSWNISTALMYAVIEPAKNDAPALRKWDITLVDENGTVELQLLEVTLRQAEASSNPKITVESIPAIEVLPSDDDITGLVEQALSELIASYLKLPIEEYQMKPCPSQYKMHNGLVVRFFGRDTGLTMRMLQVQCSEQHHLSNWLCEWDRLE